MKTKIVISEPIEAIDPLLTELARQIHSSKRVLVITGAGISCSGGIPDFRSEDGLYNLIKKKHPKTFIRGRDLFDATLFKDRGRTECFYTFMAELKSLISTANPTPTHSFIRSMQQKGQLMRCYTQNVDCLEDPIELPVVRLHGSMDTVKCNLCCSSFGFSTEYEDQFRLGNPPICPHCENLDNERVRLGKRQLSMGTLRPNIVLYNEDHPDSETIGRMQTTDIRKRPDLLIVMGTSLKIPGLKKFIKEAARMIHANSKQGKVIFVNRTAPTKEWEKIFDYEVIGDTDDWVNMMEPKLAHHEVITAERLARLKQKKDNATSNNNNNNQHVNNNLTKKRKTDDDQKNLIVTNHSRSQLTLDDTFRAQRHKTAKKVLIFKQ